MRIATIEIEGLTPYSQSKALESDKKKDETHEDFARRIWQEHMHVNADGKPFIPAVSILQGMAGAASYLAKGGNLKKQGQSTWAQNFLCGLAVAQGPVLKSDAPRSEGIYANLDGKRGGSKRGWRWYPIFDNWSTMLTIHVLDDTIPEEVFGKVVEAFGLFIGIGRYRPQNGGYLGRFTVKKLGIKKA